LPTSGFMASQMGTLVTNMGWILHRIFSDPGLYPNLPADCSPFLLRSPLAGLLMQISNHPCTAQTHRCVECPARSRPSQRAWKTAALLHHLGDLVTIFTGWESHLVPKHHCLVGVPEHHWAREDMALLSSELYGETASFPAKLSGWLAAAKACLSPTGLESPPANTPNFASLLPALTQHAATKFLAAAQTAAAKKRKWKQKTGRKTSSRPQRRQQQHQPGTPHGLSRPSYPPQLSQ